jgi:hypothetical protein
LPDGVSRSASGVEEDCFTNVDETDTTLDFGCTLSDLNSLGSKSKQPLIIMSRNDFAQGIGNILIVGNVVSGTFHENINEALQKYRNNAEILKSDDCVGEVRDILINTSSGDFPENGFLDSTFVFLEGSSGSGKSQMGFTIKASIQSLRQVFYFLFDSPGSDSQRIYLNFENTSRLFTKCCSADGHLYSVDASSPNCGSLFGENLYVYGFIYELLSNQVLSSDVKIETKSGKDVRDLMIMKKIDQCRPIFILDECIAIRKESLKKVRFVRNCFRTLGFGLVMLGTDSRAAKLTSNIGNSSRSDLPRPWCYVVGQFPAVNLSLLDLPPEVHPWLKYILVNSRPLFAQLASAQFLNDFTDFDTLMKDIFMNLIQVKKIFGSYYGKLGQLRLFQNAHYSLDDWNNLSTALIHSHFAQLKEVSKSFVLMNDGCKKNTEEIWKPCSAFPKVQDDILLYLLLMGGKYHPAFRLNGHEVPYSHFLMEVKGDPDFRSHILDLSNAVQKSNDGMFLESLLCSTVCLASHSNGVQGIALKQFLLNLVYHLQVRKLDRDEISISGLEQLNGTPFTVPFLSPANQVWPLDFQIPEAYIGSLERSSDVDRIDLKTSCGLFGESKDYGSEIKIETMRQILERVPEEAIVELVFTRRLQKSYFNPPAPSFDIQFLDTHLLQKAFYKIDASKPDTLLEQIKGIPCGKNPTKGVVIFFEIDSNLLLRP